MRARSVLLAVLLMPVLSAIVCARVSGDAGLGLAIGFVALVSSAVTAFALDRSLRRPMDELNASILRAIEGDLSARNAVAHDGQVGALARNLNVAADAWSGRIRALHEEANALTAVLDGMSEGVWVTDPHGRVVRHNVTLKELLFNVGQDLLGKRPLEIFRSEALSDAVTRACERGDAATVEVTVEGLRPRALSVNVSPLRELGGSTAVFHDVTELRRLEKVRKDFVANVSHELRTPITAIRGYAETLRDGAIHDKQHAAEMVEIIHRQSERLSLLVEDLLELSRLEARELELELVDVQLAEAVQRAADAVRPKANGKNVSLVLSVSPTLRARGDERAVEQVVLNLLDNAVKYTPRGGHVEVTGREENGRVSIQVNDSGVGIDEKHLPRVFERFYRVDKGRSRDMGGTGLGLSIVKHLMNAMEGDVSVQSKPGVGSTFSVVFPRSAARSAADEKPSRAG